MSTISVPPEMPDANQDCIALRTAFEDIGCDKNVVLDVVCHRNLQQRLKIRSMYARKYEEDLLQRLRSELHFKLEKALVLWMCNPAERDAIIIKDSLKTFGRDEMAILEILCLRTSAELEDVRHAYHTFFNSSLEGDIAIKTSGDEKKLFLAFIRQNRPDECSPDMLIAQEDAKRLFNTIQNRNNVDKAAIMSIFSTRSQIQLRTTFEQYRISFGHGFGKALKESHGAFLLKLCAVAKCVENPVKYFAKALYAALKGFGTDDSALVRIIVSHAEVDMRDIKVRYQQKFSKSLQQMIGSDTHGHYRVFLLLLIGAPPHELHSTSLSHQLASIYK